MLFMKILGTALLALALHALLGWAWVVPAGVVGGYWAGRRGVLVGFAGVALAWLGLVVFTYAVAPYAAAELGRVMGGILGNLPAGAFVGITLLVGSVLGGLGGLVGAQVRRVLTPTAPRR